MHRQVASTTLLRAVKGLLATAAVVTTTVAYTAETELEEVIVRGVADPYRPEEQTSATGLQMKLIDTPQSVSVLTTEMMKVAGANSIYEATDMVPGMQAAGTGYGLDRFILRGNRVETHRINGTRFGVGKSLEGFAMDRFEVVRGPATVLYGVTGSFGGEINQLLKRPDEDFRAEFGFEGGDFDLSQYEADVTGSIPGTDGAISGRLLGLYREWDLPVDVASYDNRKHMVMGSLKFQLAENTTSTVWLYQSSLHEDSWDGGFLQQPSPGVLVLPNVSDKRWYYSDTRYDRNEPQQLFAIADLQHRFSNDYQFKAQTTLNRVKNRIAQYFPFGPAGAYDLGDDEVYFYAYDQASEARELTFDASLNGKFQLLGREQQFAAAFEYAGTLDPTLNTLWNSTLLGVLNLHQGGQGVLADGTPVPLLDGSQLTIRNYNKQDYDDYRFSLQMLLTPIDRLHVLVGGLLQRSEIKSTAIIQGSEVIENPQSDKFSYTEPVFRAGLTWDWLHDAGPIDDLKPYFSYSEGFNPNIGVFDGDGNALTDPQEMRQYEVGIKADFLGGAIGSSLALYDSELTNVPVNVNFLGEFGSAGSALEGKRKIRGLEFELVGELLPGWNMACNYAYTDSEISDPNFDFTIPSKTVPRHAGAVFTSYEFIAGPLRGLRVGGAIVAKDKYTFIESLTNVERFGQYTGDGYTRVDLSASYSPKTGPLEGWEIYANARNVTDADIYTAKEDHPGFAVTREDYQQFTAGLRYSFGSK